MNNCMLTLQTLHLSNIQPLASLSHPWLSAIDNGQIVYAIFLDLKRAFDTVDTLILLGKLRVIGCSDSALRWFESYLSDRSQNVMFNNASSETRFTSVGVPQGSILGPLLFLIAINDLPSVVRHSNLTMYADDTTLYMCGVDHKELYTAKVTGRLG